MAETKTAAKPPRAPKAAEVKTERIRSLRPGNQVVEAKKSTEKLKDGSVVPVLYEFAGHGSELAVPVGDLDHLFTKAGESKWFERVK